MVITRFTPSAYCLHESVAPENICGVTAKCQVIMAKMDFSIKLASHFNYYKLFIAMPLLVAMP